MCFVKIFKHLNIHVLLVFTLLFGCETKNFDEQGNNPAGETLNESTFFSKGYFEGLASITNITDSSVVLNWRESISAKEYYVYDVSLGTPILVDKISAPASRIQVKNLQSGKLYTFNVKIKDSDGLLDSNQIFKSALTNNFPTPPTAIIRTSPVKYNDIDVNPSFTIFGVNPGDTVTLHTDPTCVSEVGKAKTDTGFISITSKSLTPGAVYTFYSKRKNVNGKESVCSSVSASYNLLRCPEGYVEIDQNNSYGLNSFCVMRYEAKAWSDLDSDNIPDSFEIDSDGCLEPACTTKNWGLNSFVPGSSYQGKPWRMLDASSAKQACKSLGSSYDLISNREWLAMAEEIEANSFNWSSGVVGSGCLYQGNTGKNSACSYNINGIDQGLARDSKASHVLSSGEVIWDVSGNIAEWIDWGMDSDVTRVPVTCNDSWGDIQSDFCDGNIISLDFLPLNPGNVSNYDSSYGIGQAEGGVGGYVVRGGAYQYENLAGIYSFSLAQTIQTAREEVGFRCVYRIPNL